MLKISLFEIKGKLTDNNNKYRVTAILKVETGTRMPPPNRKLMPKGGRG
jgi:hypothetical protein